MSSFQISIPTDRTQSLTDFKPYERESERFSLQAETVELLVLCLYAFGNNSLGEILLATLDTPKWIPSSSSIIT
jgi:hypothetical protein